MDDSLVLARVPCAPGSRLSFSWGMGTELRLIELRPPESVRPSPGEEEVAPYMSRFSNPALPPHRAVAAAVAPQWSELQVQLRQSRDTAGSPAAGAVPAHNAALAAFCLATRQQLMKQGLCEGCEALGVEGALWGLLELLHLHAAHSEGYLAEELAAWLEEQVPFLARAMGTGPDLGERVAQLLSGGAVPESDPDYWPLVTHLVCVGRVPEALQLLEVHTAMQAQVAAPLDASSPALTQQVELLNKLYMLLRQMPRYKRAYVQANPGMQARSTGAAGRQFTNMAEFLAYRSNWQDQVVQLPAQYPHLFQASDPAASATATGVHGVLAVLSGNEAAVLALCTSWLEAAVAQLLHLKPQLQLRQHTQGLLGASLRAVPIPAQHETVLGLLRDVMQASAEGDALEVVALLSVSPLMSAWFMAHAYDLLAAGAGPRAAAPLTRPLPLIGCNQMEYYRLLLAETLMPGGSSAAASSAWQLALSYLAFCPQHGRPAAEALLSMLPVGSGAGPLKLLRKATAAARELGLASTAASMARAASATVWYEGRVGLAAQLVGAAAGGVADPVRVAAVVGPLEEYLTQQLAALEPNYQAPNLPQLPSQEVAALMTALNASSSDRSSNSSTHTSNGSGSGGFGMPSISNGSSSGVGSSTWLHSYASFTTALAQLANCQAAVAATGAQDPTAPAATTASAAQAQAELQQAAATFVASLVRLVDGSSSGSSSSLGPATAKEGQGGYTRYGAAGGALATPLLLPTLARAIPALELPACAAAVDEAALAALLAAVSRAAAGLPGAAVASPAVAARCLQDVQMCVMRLACRAHVYRCTDRSGSGIAA